MNRCILTAADNEVAINKIATLDPMTTTAPQAAIPDEADLSIRGRSESVV